MEVSNTNILNLKISNDDLPSRWLAEKYAKIIVKDQMPTKTVPEDGNVAVFDQTNLVHHSDVEKRGEQMDGG